MTWLRTWRGQLTIAAALAIVGWYADIYLIRINSYYVTIGQQTMVFALLAVGLNWIGGYAGRLAFGNIMFFGLGGYVVEVGVAHHLFSPLVGLGIALAGCGVLAYGLSYALWRLDGLLFALVTFAMSLILQVVFTVWPYVGRADGLSEPLSDRTSLVDLSLATPNDYLVFGFALLLAATLFTRWMSLTRFGREVAAARDDRVAAATAGVDVKRVTAIVWAGSAAFTAAVGIYYAQSNLFVEPISSFGTTSSVQMLFPAVIGGLGQAWGPVVGCAIIPAARLLNELAGPGRLPGLNVLVYGCLLIVIVRLLPNGLLSLLPAGRSRRSGGGGTIDAQAVEAVARAGAATGAGGHVLELDGVGKTFGGLTALRDVSFTVEAGEIVALVGPNGAGKTTLFNCITGVAPASRGAIRVAGAAVARLSAHEIARLGVARTYQAIRIFPTLTAREHMLIPLAARGMPDEHRVDAALHAVGLADRADDLVSDFSPVERRRVELGRAIVADARLVLLDEAMVGLTDLEAQAMGELIRGLRDRLGVAFVVVEHVMDRVLTLVDRVVVMDQGAVLADGEPERVLNSEAVLSAYFGVGMAHA